ncbi:MAG: hypothetical protein U0531_02305 [Dehalococcoidia bacterium]
MRASVGHVRDLPKSKLGVDVTHGFAPQYEVPKEKAEIIRQLKPPPPGQRRVPRH